MDNKYEQPLSQKNYEQLEKLLIYTHKTMVHYLLLILVLFLYDFEGKGSTSEPLNWRMRLNVVLEAAQGLGPQ
jgi:hypothetical protein